MVNAVEFLQNVQLVCLAVIFGCMALANRQDQVLRLVWYSFLAQGLSGIVDLASSHLPLWVGHGLNLEAAPISFALLNMGIATFVRHGFWTRWLSFAVIIVGLPFYLYWSGSDAAQINSVAVLDVLTSIQTVCTAWLLAHSKERATALPRYTLASFSLLFAGVGFYRAGIVAVYHVPVDHIAPALEMATAMVYIVAVSMMPLNLIWMMNARMRQELKRESLLDPLTSLLNRRGFDEAAQREMARYRRGRQDFAVAIADIDDFKLLNDTHGHSCGDDVLRNIAQFFADELRQSDVVSRSGGEEFTFLLPVTSTEEMFAVLDRVRNALERRVLATDGDVKIAATISIGVTNSAGRRDLRLEELQREADKALYGAKRNGRNRTVCFGELAAQQGTDQLESVSLTTA